MIAFTSVPSPLGDVVAAARDDAVVAMTLAEPAPGWRRDDRAAPLVAAREQLDAYFAGELRAFDLPLDLAGTTWQKVVWDAVAAIPYGETRTYRDLAAEVCTPAAARAVGHANGRNPACIVIPCHRVIGSDGSLTGYAYGLPAKQALLRLEGAL